MSFDHDKFFDPPKGMMDSFTPVYVNLKDLTAVEITQWPYMDKSGSVVIAVNGPPLQNDYICKINHDGTITFPHDMEGVVTVTYKTQTRRELKQQTKELNKRSGQNYLNLRKERW